jgi:release factor glutamine methyltransferase
MIARRLGREPVSQIVGEREFWSQSFAVTAATLTPRPATEAVVAAVLGSVQDRVRPWRVLDLGTGTGCLLLALLVEMPMATGVGVDISGEALTVARTNARRHGLDRRASFLVGDWAAAIEPGFDIVVSNPPYVESGAMATLAPEVVQWEPRLALDGGEDGLGAYRRILPDLPRLLPNGGFVVLEHGLGQSERVEMLAVATGLSVAKRCQDLAGRDRCLVLKR